MKTRSAIWIALAALALLATPALAQSSSENSFTIAPPPLSYPDYSAPGTSMHRVTGTYVSVSVDKFDLTGIGAAYGGRWVLAQTGDGLGQGLGVNGGVFLLSGSGGGLSLSGIVETVGVNYERELTHNDQVSAIFFIGPSLSLAYLSGTSDAFDLEATTVLAGGQVGAQVTFASGNLKISPWAMYTAQSGSTSATVSTAFGDSTTDSDISVATTSFGFDVLHVPSSLTLSGMLQSSGGDSDANVTILSFSYTFGGKRASEAEQAAPAKSAHAAPPLANARLAGLR